MKYRKKPVVIDAWKWDGTLSTLKSIDGIKVYWECGGGGSINIKTLEGYICASVGDWIIKGVKGEFYPCKDDVFQKSYEPVI